MMRPLTVLISAVLAATAGAQSNHSSRDRGTLDPVARPMTVTPQQALAVERGLEWLVTRQNADGSWSSKVGYKLNESYDYEGVHPHVGVTSLACMAFLAGGHVPGRGPYADTIERGLDFVLSCVNDDGFVSHARTRMYSHAFATLFLAEIYGMTHREDVRRQLQKAVDYVVRCQNSEGGWRYVPFAPESDMSIVVCQVLALRAARNIGISVPRATIDRASRYVKESAINEGSRPSGYRRATQRNIDGSFRYQKKSGTRSSFSLTAAGVTSLHGVGIYSDKAIVNGLEYLVRHLEDFNRKYGHDESHYFFWYGHYYGVQAMYTAGTSYGKQYWEPYFEKVRAHLLDMQREDGRWPNRTGPGDEFGTAMAVLILEIPFRFLPIFQR